MRNELVLRQISRKLELLRGFSSSSVGIPSWIQFIRKSLGLSVRQLSLKTGLAGSTLHQLERAEGEGGITINKLRQLAAAMDGELYYAIIPNRPIEKIVAGQALKRAKAIVAESQLQMEYEDQAVETKHVRTQILELADQLKFSKQLWDD